MTNHARLLNTECTRRTIDPYNVFSMMTPVARSIHRCSGASVPQWVYRCQLAYPLTARSPLRALEAQRGLRTWTNCERITTFERRGSPPLRSLSLESSGWDICADCRFRIPLRQYSLKSDSDTKSGHDGQKYVHDDGIAARELPFEFWATDDGSDPDSSAPSPLLKEYHLRASSC